MIANIRNKTTTVKLLALCLLMAGTTQSEAVTVSWLGTTDANWGTASNWSSGAVPTAGALSTATFNGAGNGNTTINLGNTTRPNYGMVFTGAATPSYTFNNGRITLLPNSGTPYALDVQSSVTSAQIFNATLGFNVGNSTSAIIQNNGQSYIQLTDIVGGNGGSPLTNRVQLQGSSLSTSNVVNGVISNGVGVNATVVGLTKAGTGTWTLAGTNTYTGTTTVSNGTLLVNGSLAAGSAVTVSGGRLGGNGTINGSTTIASGGTLAVGNSPGVMTFNGTLTLAGTTAAEINGLTRGTLYDGINTGNNLLTLGGTLNLNFGALTSDLALYDLIDIGAGGYTGSFSSVNLAGLYTGSLTNNAGIWTGTDGGFNFSFSEATGDLSVVAVPEPSTYALLGLGLGSLWILRRRSVRVSNRGN